MIQESKELCPIETYLSFGRSKLLHSCSYFTLKSELEQTVKACLAGSEMLRRFSILDLSKHRAAIRGDFCQASAMTIHKTTGYNI